MDSDSPLRPIAREIVKQFIQRRDVKAKQHQDGAYSPIKSQITYNDMGLHLEGKMTYGHYLVDPEGMTRVLAFDLDFISEIEVPWQDDPILPRQIFNTDGANRGWLNKTVRGLADGLAWKLKRLHPELNVMTLFSGSKGIHVYGTFPEPVDAGLSRRISINILNSFGCFEPLRGKNFYRHRMLDLPIEIEVYPKQESIGKGGYGNLLRMPLGVNQKTGNQSFFYRTDGPLTQLRAMDPLTALQHGTVG